MFPDGFNMVCIRSLSFQNQRHRYPVYQKTFSRGHVQLTMTDDSGLKSMMYNAGSIDKKSIVTNRQDALRVMRLFKRTEIELSIHYKEEEQVIRNRKNYTILKMEP
jgi:hypothetical protein